MMEPNTNTLARIQAVIAEELDNAAADLRPERRLEELGLDSLAVIEIMFRLEEIFDVRMGDERVPIKTIQDIVDNVDILLCEREAAVK